jgi:hypothetical protein
MHPMHPLIFSRVKIGSSIRHHDWLSCTAAALPQGSQSPPGGDLQQDCFLWGAFRFESWRSQRKRGHEQQNACADNLETEAIHRH